MTGTPPIKLTTTICITKAIQRTVLMALPNGKNVVSTGRSAVEFLLKKPSQRLNSNGQVKINLLKIQSVLKYGKLKG